MEEGTTSGSPKTHVKKKRTSAHDEDSGRQREMAASRSSQRQQAWRFNSVSEKNRVQGHFTHALRALVVRIMRQSMRHVTGHQRRITVCTSVWRDEQIHRH